MKAQIRMGESIAVLVVFFFLIVIAYSFYVKIQQSSLAVDIGKAQELRAIQLAQLVYYMPEVQCSSGTQLVKESCFDTLKLEKFKGILAGDGRLFYFGLFGYNTIYIKQVYPNPGLQWLATIDYDSDGTSGADAFLLYKREPPQDDPIRFKSTKVAQMPVALYDPIQKKYAYAYLVVEYVY